MSWRKKIKKGKKAVIRDRNQSPNEKIAVSHIQKIGKLRQHRRQKYVCTHVRKRVPETERERQTEIVSVRQKVNEKL